MKYGLFLIIILLAVGGCSFTQDDAESDAITQSFNNFVGALVKEDWRAAYDLRSISLNQSYPFEEFIKDCEQDKDYYKVTWRGAFLSNISVTEKKDASARVKLGNGSESIIDFIKEDNIWKINRLGTKIIPRSGP